MGQLDKKHERNNEIVAFFYLIFGKRIHAGLAPDDARKEAYDAVYLRYNIGRRYLLNLISSNRNERKENKAAFMADALALIEDLTDVNEELAAMQDRNEKLISLLRECVDENDY